MVLTVADSHTLEHVHLYPLFVGIDRSRVEDMENRLKQDVLREAAQYNNQILVAHENDDFQVIEQWEAVTEVDVQTPLEVYRELSGKCYNLPSSHVHHALSIALGRLLPSTGHHSSQHAFLCTSKDAQHQWGAPSIM